MPSYKMVTRITDLGPYVEKLILPMPCSVRVPEGNYVALELREEKLGRRTEGGIARSDYVHMAYRITGFFAGAIASCQAFFDKNMTDEMISRLKEVPLWFAHTKNDELVPEQETTIPIYRRLKAAGAKSLHFSFFDYMEDLTGRYRDGDGQPMRFFNHGVWVHVLNDHCIQDIDGGRVLEDGIPVTMWEWLGYQS